MVSIRNLLLLLPLVTAVPLQKRTFGQLIVDTVTIGNKAKALASAIEAWDGGFFTVLPILTAEKALETSINTGTTDAKATETLTVEQATSLGTLIQNNLIPDTQNLGAALKAKKASFQAIGVVGTVKGYIQTLQTEQDEFADALLAITPDEKKVQGEQDKATVDAGFEDVKVYYST